AVTHGDTVIHGNGIELFGDAAGGFDFFGNESAQIAQVHVTRHKLRKRVHYRNNRFAKVAVLHTGGAPEGASAGHVTAVGGSTGTVLRHDISRTGKVRKVVNNTPDRPGAVFSRA